MTSTDDIAPGQRERLERFAARVAASPHNLVSRRAREELRSRHVPECVALARLLPRGAARLLDIGSGGGLPGLVIAIVRPDLEVHLLDSTRKKAAFLREVAAELEVAVTVHTGRAEELAVAPLARSFDLVTARAVAPLVELIPLAVPYLTRQGLLYAVKGDRWPTELDDAAATLTRQGARLVATPRDIAGLGDGCGVPAPRVVIIGRSR